MPASRASLRANLPARCFAASFLPCVKGAMGLAAGWPPVVAVRSGRATPLPEDGYNATRSRIDAADRARLDACASAWGMTSHDLLLAIVLKGTSPLTAATTAIADAQRDRGRVDREHPSRTRGGSQRRARAVSGVVPRIASGARRHRLRELAARDPRADESRSRRQTLPADAVRHRISGSNGVSCRRRSASGFSPSTTRCAGMTPLSVDSLWSGGARREPGLTTCVPFPPGRSRR